jgi:hypothetical protein
MSCGHVQWFDTVLLGGVDPAPTPADTLSDEIEPYLLREQFIVRTPRGRLAAPRAYQLLGRPMKPRPEDLDPQRSLADE